MFMCCLPRSRGCRRKKGSPADAVPRWGFHVRTPHRLWPFGRKDRKKATEDMERRLLDTPSVSSTEGVTPQGSPGADAGDCRGRPPTQPRPLSQVVVHRSVVQEPEPTEAKAEAAPPSEDLELAPTPSAALGGGVVPTATSGAHQEPAGLPEPHPEPTALQGELLVPSPDPDASPECFIPLVPLPDPDASSECFIPSPDVLSLWFILTVILSFHVLYTVYYLF
ncbi:vegetative cell wall protein gp1-like isoform X1 [Zalophus californianus]|uniref:Vegetative cell wall protein gp1-like isoform X1 n=1 Tax=Zalophus californianus TaxID=9704 RepID=A0A6P9FEV6_ZALCA|nr:vegetative cell wall protein gp1-like isoform X1 [Zalophus californianus]